MEQKYFDVEPTVQILTTGGLSAILWFGDTNKLVRFINIELQLGI